LVYWEETSSISGVWITNPDDRDPRWDFDEIFVVPEYEPELHGVVWLKWNGDKNCVICLWGGGLTQTGEVVTACLYYDNYIDFLPITEYDVLKHDFLRTLLHNNFTVVSPANPDINYWTKCYQNRSDVDPRAVLFGFVGYAPFFRDTCSKFAGHEWLNVLADMLINQGYTPYLFGFSAGGSIIGYDIQEHQFIGGWKQEWGYKYAASVIASGKVDYCMGVANSSPTADKILCPVQILAPVEDEFTYSGLQEYYDNALKSGYDVDFVEWNGGHGDIFSKLSLDGRTLADVVIRWFNAH